MSTTRPTIAVQLYTLRNLTATDMAGTLRRVKEIGYEGVEFAGYGNLTAEEIANLVQELGLKVVSSHTSADALQNNLEGVLEDNRLFNNRYLVCPSIPVELRGSAAGYRQFAGTLNEIGKRVADAGMVLCYHNHAFELEDNFDGVYGLDLLYQNSDPQFLQAEIDTYWIKKGGEDPAAYIAKYAGRAPLIHIKDMSGDGQESFAEVGTGSLDWPAIFAASANGGAVAYIVEQDICPGDPLESIRISFENLKSWGKLG